MHVYVFVCLYYVRTYECRAFFLLKQLRKINIYQKKKKQFLKDDFFTRHRLKMSVWNREW